MSSINGTVISDINHYIKDYITIETDHPLYPTEKKTVTSPATSSSIELPHNMYVVVTNTAATALTFTLATPTEGEVGNYEVEFVNSSSSSVTATWPSTITWPQGSLSSLAGNKTTLISIKNNIGFYYSY